MPKTRKKSTPIECPKCRLVVESRTIRNGLCNRCYNQEYYKSHREKIIQNANKWKENNRERYNANRVKIMMRKYYALTPEERREKDRIRASKMSNAEREKRKKRSRDYYAAHKKRLREYQKRYKVLKPEVKQSSENKRRALKKGVGADLTSEQWIKIKAAYNHRCAYCGKKKKLTQDHVIPLSKGGKHTTSNVVPACNSCNAKKHTNPPSKPVKIVML